MTHLMSTRPARLATLLLLALALALPSAAVATAALAGGGPQVIRNAACDGHERTTDNTSSGCGEETGLAGFTNAANAIVNPAVIAMIAIAPIGSLVGAAALMFGNRRGLTIIGASLGTLVFVISIRGIVA